MLGRWRMRSRLFIGACISSKYDVCSLSTPKLTRGCSELGQIKYLKDGDDCDLDPEQLLSDVFVNEGKAASDGLDQTVILNVVQQQGSSARGDSFAPDLTPSHYKVRPRSAAPEFPELASTLGKRSHSNITDSLHQSAEKRSKLVEIPESQDDTMPTIERSPELIRDTQHEPQDEDVFDDAEEVQDQPNGMSLNGKAPYTPSTARLPNGTGSSGAGKFKSSGRKDTYAPPESDIEDSQISPARKSVGAEVMKDIEAQPSQGSQNRTVIEAFNAREALPDIAQTLIDKKSPVSPQGLGAGLTNGINGPRDEDSTSEDKSGSVSENEPAPLPVPNTQQTPASTKSAKSADKPKVTVPKGQTSEPSKKRKREETEKGKSSTKPKSSAAGAPSQPQQQKKKQKGAVAEVTDRLKLALPQSPSRRTSGVVSELDSPGEQLSQSLWDSASNFLLGPGETPQLTKKQKEYRRRKLRKAGAEEASRSESGSRPTSSAGPDKQPSVPPPDVTNPRLQAESKKKAEMKAAPKAEKERTLSQKLKDATARAASKSVEAVVGKQEMKEPSASGDDSDEEEGAPLPSIEKAAVKNPITPGTKSTLPLPKWGSAPNGSRNTPATVNSAYIVPAGMTEEEYLKLRAQHELTPQPSKPNASKKKKENTPAVPAKVATATKEAAQQVAQKGKKVLEKAPKIAKTIAKRTVAAESSSDRSEDGSSSGSEEEERKPPKKDTKPQSASKSKSPAEVRKEDPATLKKAKNKTAMPPPTPNTTAKRRESTNKKQTEQSTSSSASQDSSSKSSSSGSSSSSKSPAPAPQATPPTAKAKTAPTPAKKTNPAATASKPTKAATPTTKPTSGLKALRQKINSQAASPAPSSSAAAAAKKKKPPVQESSSESESSSSDDDSSSSDNAAAKKETSNAAAAKKGRKGTPLGRSEREVDQSIRDQTPDSSSGEEESD